MARQINNIENHNQRVAKHNTRIVFVFRNQQLLDLWINEMQGQISDGMWENSRKTEWLWRNEIVYRFGDKTQLLVDSLWMVGKKNFFMTKDLWECIGDRIMDENGFATEKEAKAAWRELAMAIYTPELSPEPEAIAHKYRDMREKNVKSQIDTLKQEWWDLGLEDGYEKRYATTYIWSKEETGHSTGYVSVEPRADKEGNLMHQINYDSRSYLVKVGKLKEALETLRNFVKTMETYKK